MSSDNEGFIHGQREFTSKRSASCGYGEREERALEIESIEGQWTELSRQDASKCQ